MRLPVERRLAAVMFNVAIGMMLRRWMRKALHLIMKNPPECLGLFRGAILAFSPSIFQSNLLSGGQCAVFHPDEITARQKPQSAGCIFILIFCTIRSRVRQIYGAGGFVEIQPLIPEHHGARGIAQVLELCQRHGKESYLCGLKYHNTSGGMLSFAGRDLVLVSTSRCQEAVRLRCRTFLMNCLPYCDRWEPACIWPGSLHDPRRRWASNRGTRAVYGYSART